MKRNEMETWLDLKVNLEYIVEIFLENTIFL